MLDAALFFVVGGTRVLINRVLLPKDATSLFIKARNPAPADKTIITVAIPIIIPTVVKTVLAGFAFNALIDWLKAFSILFVS
jgi:hypothetical protein